MPGPFRPAQAHQRYLLQLGYVDTLIGRLLDRMEKEGLYDRALLVVTADHGVSFRPAGAGRAVKRENFAEVANVPMFVETARRATRPDRRRAIRDDRPAAHDRRSARDPPAVGC